MNESQANLFRSLGDKLYEKRKAAALEVEIRARSAIQQKNSSEASSLLKELSEAYHSSASLNLRKGVLLALAAAAIGFGKYATPYLHDLLEPILHAAAESDSRLRYFACESLYNVTKAVRTLLVDDHFNSLFITVSRLNSDGDQNVRSGAELLDRLLKDIVTESNVAPNISVLLRERIYVLDSQGRSFVAGWITHLSGNPHTGLSDVLPALVDGLFQALSDRSKEVQRQVQNALEAVIFETDRADVSQLIPIVANQLVTVQTGDTAGDTKWLIRYSALLWLRKLLPSSTAAAVKSSPVCLQALFSFQSFDSDLQSPEVTSEVMKERQRSIEVNDLSQQVDQLLKTAVAEGATSNELIMLLEVITNVLEEPDSVSKKLQAFLWIEHILDNNKENIQDELDSLIYRVIQSIIMTEKHVRSKGLDCLAKMANLSPGSYEFFINSLISSVESVQELTERNRIAFILRELCSRLSGETLFCSLSRKLNELPVSSKSISIVQLLNLLISTAPQLFSLRQNLQNESESVFPTLWECWTQCPISSLSLALLGKRYSLAYQTVTILSKMNLTKAHLAEFDRLIQLLESPGFTSLRFELLERPPTLLATLHGVLMLLPQSKAFDLLFKRLSVVTTQPFNPETTLTEPDGELLYKLTERLTKSNKDIENSIEE